MESPMVQALMGAKEKLAAPKVDPMENPAVGNELDGTFFLPKETVGADVKVGDTVTIRAEVQSVGSKIAFSPVEVMAGEGEEEQEPMQPESAPGKARIQI